MVYGDRRRQGDFPAPGYLRLAEIDCTRRDWKNALDHVNRSLLADAENLNALNLKVLVLRALGLEADAAAFLKQITALDPLDTFSRFLDRQQVPSDGQQCLDLAFDLLVKNRFPYSACNLGIAVAAYKMAVEHAKHRSTFGAPLSQRQAIQWMLADALVEIRATRWLIWEGAWKADRGEDFRTEASIAKLYSSEVLGRVVDRAVQIHGGYGVSKEFPIERWYREARIRRIGEAITSLRA